MAVAGLSPVNWIVFLSLWVFEDSFSFIISLYVNIVILSSGWHWKSWICILENSLITIEFRLLSSLTKRLKLNGNAIVSKFYQFTCGVARLSFCVKSSPRRIPILKLLLVNSFCGFRSTIPDWIWHALILAIVFSLLFNSWLHLWWHYNWKNGLNWRLQVLKLEINSLIWRIERICGMLSFM